MQKNMPAIDNFCTTLPSYITEMLQAEAESDGATLSDVLLNILENHYGIGDWREKLTNDTFKHLELEMKPYGGSLWRKDVCEKDKTFKVYFDVELPFKAEVVLEVSKARYGIQFIIYTTAKKYRKMFRNFYSHYRDGLLNRDMQLEEFARFATIGYKRNFTSFNIKEIINSDSFALKLTEDGIFLKNIILMNKWT
ncbi:MAG TPA: hypothetical protein DCE11_05965 [Ruminiclostridium sp.]|jgi:spore coat protein CotH|nr:hypothetical protein [Ruminiclostridium sp.]